ncbi:MAG: malto-oligosyltrehalose synthase, partial [Frankia sp.]|nr:malto-oligosyltrehalose synthase [Frankia sp.]
MPQPTATYRLQLHAGFTFDDAAAVAPYLADLGVSHVYCSPYLQAAPGSAHGYDVIDHGRVNSEIGGADGLKRFRAALDDAGLGQVLDIVPNHMYVDHRDNVQWWDVLRNGPDSPYAEWFDIDWTQHGGRVLLPVLGAPLADAITRGELAVDTVTDEPVLRYFEHAWPLSERSVAAGLHDLATVV